MGGRETAGGEEFRARVAAYLAVHVLTGESLPRYGVRPGVPVRIALEQGDAGDDIRLEASDRLHPEKPLVYTIQVKHGLAADRRLGEAVARFAARLEAGEFGLLMVDRGSSNTITSELPEVFDRWRNDQEPELSDSLADKLAPLLPPTMAHVRKRLAVGILDLENDHNDGVRFTVQLLRAHLVDAARAGDAWNALFTLMMGAAKKAHAYDRARLLQLMADAGLDFVGDERRDVGSSPGPAVAAPLATEHPPELRVIASLIDRVHPRAALDALAALDNACATALQRSQRLSLRAAAMLQLSEAESARTVLMEALEHTPFHVPALMHLTLAEAMLGNHLRAAEVARLITEREPERARGWATRIQIGDATLEDVPDALRSDSEISAAAGFIALRVNAPARAIELLEPLVVSATTFEPQRASLLAAALIAQAANDSGRDEAAVHYRRALALLDHVLEIARDPDAGLHRVAVWNRAEALHALGEVEGALTAYRQLAARGGDTRDLALRYGQLALRSGRHMKEALDVVERAGRAEDRPELHALRARLHAATGDRRSASAALTDATRALPPNSTDPEAIICVASAAIETGERETGRLVLAGAPPATADARYHVLRARLSADDGDVHGADEAYAAALRHVEVENERAVRLEFASHLRQTARPREAAQILVAIADDPDPRVARLLAETSFEAGEYSRAEFYSNRAGDIAWAVRILAFLAIRGQHLADAERLLLAWNGLAPDEAEPLLRLAELRTLRDDLPAARDALAHAAPLLSRPADRVRLAWSWQRAGDPESALAVGVAALRDASEDDAIVRAFTEIALLATMGGDYTPPKHVAPGVSVTLKTSTSEHTYLLTSDAGPRTALGEMSVENPLALRLLGRSVGESVLYRTAPSESGTITEIHDWRTHYVRWAARENDRRDPAASVLRPMRVVDAEGKLDVDAIFAPVREKAAREAEVLDSVEQQLLPFGHAGWRLGISVAEVYGRLSSDPQRVVPVEEMDAEPAVRSITARPIVLTRTALLTFGALDSLRYLEGWPDGILVPSALLEQLRSERLEHVDVARNGRRAIGLTPLGPALHETTPEVGQQILAAHDRLLTWVTTHTTPVLPDRPANRSEIWDHLTPESEEAVLVAKERGAVLLTDDLGLRRITKELLPGVEGASTFAFLTALHRQGTLDQDAYAQVMARLLGMGHVVLPIHVTHLVEAVRLDPQRLVVFKRAIGHLRAPYVDGVAAARVTARFLRSCAIEPAAQINFAKIAELCFEAVLTPRPLDEGRLVDVMSKAIRGEFFVWPGEGDRLLRQLAVYIALRAQGIW